MASTARSTSTRRSRYDREQLHEPDRGVRAREDAGDPQVRRDRRGRVPARRRPPQGRPDAARHRVAARRAPARTCASRCSPRATPPARREEAGADVVGADDLVARIERRLPRLRRRDRDARPDGPGRQARPRARSARPDAEPEDRHRHHRRRQDRRRVQGRQGRVPHRPLRQRARADRQGELPGREPA